MRLVTMFKFALQSVTAGLALAFVVLALKPEWIPDMAGTTSVARGKQDDVVSYSRAVAIATPAVVNIYTAKAVTGLPSPLLNDPFFKRYFADTLPAMPTQISRSRGSGVIMSPEGYVVTNHHLIRGADEIRVMLQDGREASATVFGADPDTDLAVLKIELGNLPAITINGARQPRVGYVVRGWLGIEVQAFAQTDADRPAAVTVVKVLPKTPAERAGLQAGDVLTRVDDTPVADPQSALNAIARVKPGNQVSLGIVRNGEPREVVITVAQRPQEG